MEDTNSRKVDLRLGFEICVDEVIEILEEDMSKILVECLEGQGSASDFYVQRN
jgi:hypothetical protein